MQEDILYYPLWRLVDLTYFYAFHNMYIGCCKGSPCFLSPQVLRYECSRYCLTVDMCSVHSSCKLLNTFFLLTPSSARESPKSNSTTKTRCMPYVSHTNLCMCIPYLHIMPKCTHKNVPASSHHHHARTTKQSIFIPCHFLFFMFRLFYLHFLTI